MTDPESPPGRRGKLLLDGALLRCGAAGIVSFVGKPPAYLPAFFLGTLALAALAAMVAAIKGELVTPREPFLIAAVGILLVGGVQLGLGLTASPHRTRLGLFHWGSATILC